jgi:uncharacterized membrane protein YbaN (DUF454 family)
MSCVGDESDQRVPVVAHPTLARQRWRWAWLALAYAALALGIVGIVVPGLPTTPFILLAAFAAARGSRRMHDGLLAHPVFGPMITAWEREGAISRRAKWTATIAMTVCAVVMFVVSPNAWLAAFGTATMAAVAVWMWLRPAPRSEGVRAGSSQP